MISKLRVFAAMFALVLLVGCAGAGGKGAPPAVEWSKSPTDVVFQIYTKGGFMPRLDYEAQFPELTVFGDGRVVFTQRASDGTSQVLEARLTEKQLGELLAKAANTTADMDRRYTGITATDLPTTTFYVNTAKGTKSVSVYGFGVEPWDHEENRAVMDGLRGVRKSFLEVAASGAKAYVPEEVTLLVQALAPEDSRGRPKLWPAHLPPLPETPAGDPWALGKAVHKGAEARALAEEVKLHHPAQYRVGERSYLVALRPTLPEMAREAP